MSLVQHQARLLAALQARDLAQFSQLLQDSQPDASCLEAACREADCVEYVKLLLKTGLEPNTVNPTLQHTPLHVAAELGYLHIMEVSSLLCVCLFVGCGKESNKVWITQKYGKGK